MATLRANRSPVSRIRLAILVALFACAAFLLGLRFVGAPQVPPVHPLTGRQIAGIATDAGWLDRSVREDEELPERALDLIGIAPGAVIADVGAGTGYMTMRLARRVGATGKVYANDIQPGMLRIVQDKAQRERLSNIEVVQGTETDARLPAGAVDLALLVDVYHELWRPQQLLRSLRTALRADGRLVLVEYRKEDPTIPIAPTHRMSVSDARTEVEAEGFAFVEVIGGLPRQHIIVFRKHR